MRVRLAVYEDRPQLEAIDRAIVGRPEQSQLGLRVSQQRLWVAQDPATQRLTGYLALGWLWDQLPMLQMVRVDPLFTRQGVGSRLLAAAETRARQQQAAWLLSSCEQDNQVSRAWHAAHGFAEAGHLDLPGEQRELWLVKPLGLAAEA